MNKGCWAGGDFLNNELPICALDGCDNEVIKRTHNQKYCTNAHCKEATNAKLVERYHERVAIKSGKKRICVSCEETILSSYNPSKVCAGCESKKQKSNDNDIASLSFLAA